MPSPTVTIWRPPHALGVVSIDDISRALNPGSDAEVTAS